VIVRSTRNCTNTPRLLFALEEAGVSYVSAIADDGYFTTTYGVPGPALEQDDGFTLVEIGALLRHVGRAHGPWPADLHAQADADRWLDFIHRRLGGVIRDQDAASTRALLVHLDRRLVGRDFTLGDFTVVDCAFATLIGKRARLPLEGLVHVAGYLDRLAARPAWERALARTPR